MSTVREDEEDPHIAAGLADEFQEGLHGVSVGHSNCIAPVWMNPVL